MTSLALFAALLIGAGLYFVLSQEPRRQLTGAFLISDGAPLYVLALGGATDMAAMAAGAIALTGFAGFALCFSASRKLDEAGGA